MIEEQNKNMIAVIHNGIWYYDCSGEIRHLYSPSVNLWDIFGFNFGRHVKFHWGDLNRKFWLTEEEARREAKEYLRKALGNVSPTTLKKIIKLKSGDTFFVKTNRGIYENSVEVYSSHYDKHRCAFIDIVEYDDGYLGYQQEYEYPLSSYGVDWALTREELEKRQKDARGSNRE